MKCFKIMVVSILMAVCGISTIQAKPTVEEYVMINESVSHPILDVMPALNELSLKYPAAISLGSGRPADEFCQPSTVLSTLKHYEQYAQVHKSAIPYNRLIGQYGPAAGIVNEIVAKHLEKEESIQVKPQDIIMTVGFQEAVELAIKTLFNKNDVLIIPDPIFVGITGSAILNQVKMQPISWKGENFDKELFDKTINAIKKQGLNPKALYVIPDFSNPYGSNLPLKDRLALLEWARENNLLLFEDNPYGLFRYQNEKIPTLKSLDKYKNVIYFGTAAKTIYPGLRIGYIVADQLYQNSLGNQSKLSDALSKVKSFNTVNTPPLEQALFASVLLQNDYSLSKFNQPQIEFNKKNLAYLQTLLKEQFLSDKNLNVAWNSPEGGYFMVVTLPFTFGKTELEECARDYGVIVIPLSMFSLLKAESNEIRISFTNVKPETLKIGIERFAKYVKDKIEKQKSS